MQKTHRYSGILICLFVGIHLLNHAASFYGTDAHIELMVSLRKFYRNILLETILLSAVVVQIVSGIKLFISKRNTAASFFERLQIWTGLYQAFFLVIHVMAVLVGRIVLSLDTNFYFGAAGLNSFPFNLFFIPYYGLAIISFFGHIAAIHNLKMKKNILSFSPSTQSFVILLLGIFAAVLLLYGLTNRFMSFEIPAAYKILVGK